MSPFAHLALCFLLSVSLILVLVLVLELGIWISNLFHNRSRRAHVPRRKD